MEIATEVGKVKPIRPAATLLMIRDGQDGIEVLTLRRSAAMRFLPNYLAFPGGTLDGEDWDMSPDFLIGTVRRAEQLDDVTYAIGALRESAEEVGWLCCATSEDGMYPVQLLVEEEQRNLLANQVRFSDLLLTRQTRLDMSLLGFVGRWVTPSYMPARFDTRFFVHVANGTTPDVRMLSAENDWIRWCKPEILLNRIASGEEQAVPPTIAMLEGLAKYASAEACFDALHVPGPPMEA